jgi:hypothetical protein
MGSQGENCFPNCPHFAAKIADFDLNYCILKENATPLGLAATRDQARACQNLQVPGSAGRRPLQRYPLSMIPEVRTTIPIPASQTALR